MMEFVHVFVLTSLALDKKGDVKSRNVAVTFDLFEAEDHRNKGIEHDYDVFVVPGDWRDDAEQSELVSAMREFRDIVKQMQNEALR
jgi:hypothetical protein